MVQTAGESATYELLGTCEPGDFEVRSVNKTAPAIVAGKALALTDSVTPNSYELASDASVRPFVVSSVGGAALNALTVPAFAEGKVYMKAGGAIQPGAYVMPDGNGDVVTYANSADNKLGKFIHLPGDDGAAAAKKACASGDTVLIDVNEV
jgi:hypothetical protein